MITASQAKKLKKLIGYRHMAQIQKFLDEQGVRNRYGKNYSRIYLSEVLNGRGENKVLEEHIWKLADLKMKEAQEAHEQKQAVLEGLEKISSEEEQPTLNQ